MKKYLSVVIVLFVVGAGCSQSKPSTSLELSPGGDWKSFEFNNGDMPVSGLYGKIDDSENTAHLQVNPVDKKNSRLSIYAGAADGGNSQIEIGVAKDLSFVGGLIIKSTGNTATTLFTGNVAYSSSGMEISETGEITPIQKWTEVDTYSSEPTDEICTINGVVQGQELILSIRSSERSVTILDGGPCNTVLGGPMIFDSPADRGVLQFDGFKWYRLSFADNG